MKSHCSAVVTLLACLAVMVVLAPVAQAADYVGNSKCKMCHKKADEGEIYNKWKAASHSKAFETLKSDAAKAAAKEAGVEKPPHEAPECLSCHVTAFDAKSDPHVPDKIKIEDGVQCEACHGPASDHVKDGQARKMKKDESVDPTKSIGHPDVKVCVTCHNDKSPTWNPERYTLDDGSKVGFDFKQAWKKIEHKKPE